MRTSETVTGTCSGGARRSSTDATIVVDEDLRPLVETFEPEPPPSVVVDRRGLLPSRRIRAKTIK